MAKLIAVTLALFVLVAATNASYYYHYRPVKYTHHHSAVIHPAPVVVKHAPLIIKHAPLIKHVVPVHPVPHVVVPVARHAHSYQYFNKATLW